MKNLLVAILFLSVPASAQQAQLQTFSPERSSAFVMLIVPRQRQWHRFEVVI